MKFDKDVYIMLWGVNSTKRRNFHFSQTEFLCFDFLPRHQNIVRYRKSRPMIRKTFEVCDYGNFYQKRHWKYDTLIGKNIFTQLPNKHLGLLFLEPLNSRRRL